MENILKERKIEYLYHFTKAINLSSILQHGALLPRSVLEKNQIESSVNDAGRYDGCMDAISMSLSFPNYKTFYRFRQRDKNVDWIVWEIPAQDVLLPEDRYRCAFCWTNAADSEIFRIPIEARRGKAAFLDLFADHPGNPPRESLNIPDCYPTNPQAEILVFGSVPITRAKFYVNDGGLLLEYLDNDQVGYDKKLFSPRSDWQVWRDWKGEC